MRSCCFLMRTSRMGDTEYKCKAAWDSASLKSAQGLLQSYVTGIQGWKTSHVASAAGEAAQTFKSMEHECLLFGRKFKAHTHGAVLDILEDPHYKSWNYTQEQLLPYVKNIQYDTHMTSSILLMPCFLEIINGWRETLKNMTQMHLLLYAWQHI